MNILVNTNILIPSLVSPLRAKIENVKVESRSLFQTRDILLPQLMSGEIRLREAERALEVVI